MQTSDLREVTLGQAYETVRAASVRVAAVARRLLRSGSAGSAAAASGGATETWRRRVTMAAVVTAAVACMYHVVPGMLVTFGAALLALAYFY